MFVEAIDIISYVSKELTESVTAYKKDLRALPASALANSPGGSARSPYDFTYEVVVVNERAAKRLTGEDPGPWPYTSWVTAPDEWQDIDRLCAALDDTATILIDGMGNEPFRKVSVGGEEKAAFQLIAFLSMHVMYHSAQLNMIQAMLGDDVMHWMED